MSSMRHEGGARRRTRMGMHGVLLSVAVCVCGLVGCAEESAATTAETEESTGGERVTEGDAVVEVIQEPEQGGD